MIDDAFKLTIDVAFPPERVEPLECVEVIELPKTNMWEFICKIT
jgi:hypothetical protein